MLKHGAEFQVGGIMKLSKIFVIFIFILLFTIFFSCGQGTNSTDQNTSELKYLNTVYGGCNSTARQTITEFVCDFKNDTIYYSVTGEILKITIGLNYICCAPFGLHQYQENQNLFITLYDSCGQTGSPCHCKCVCYYDFDTYFSNYLHDTYYLKVYLHDPQQTADSLIHDIVIQ